MDFTAEPQEESYNWMARGRQGLVDDLDLQAMEVEAAHLLAASFSEGDEVDTPEGVGVVVEIRTEPFEGPDDEVDWASEDEPAYVVGVESGASVFRGDDLSAGSIDVDGVDTPEQDLAAGDTSEAMLAWYYEQKDDLTAGAAAWLRAYAQDDGRRFDYPDSWDDSPTPNRIILLKAWAGLGGRFTSCRRKMAGEVASPTRFCASMKDRVLNWEGWRKGG